MPVRCECLTCGAVFYKPPFTVQDGRGRYCSKKCKHSGLALRYKGRPGWVKSGNENPNWRGRSAPKPCPVCNISFKSSMKTCSVDCGIKLRSETISGDNNPFKRAHPPKPRTCRCCSKIYVKNGTLGLGKYYCSYPCSLKTQRLSVRQEFINNWIQDHGICTEMEKSWPWLKSPHSKQRLRVDIYLSKANLAVEYDGRQHFEAAFAGGQDALRRTQERDRHKEFLLKAAGIKLIRLSGWPVDLSEIIKIAQTADLVTE